MNLPEHLEKAFDEIEKIKEPLWAVTISYDNKSKNKKRTSRFNPGKPATEQWELLSLNGRVPSSHEKEEFHQKKNLKKESKPKKDDGGLPNLSMGVPNIREVIPASALKVSKETDSQITYSFRPVIDHALLKGLMKHIDGEIVYNKTTDTVERITIQSNGKFTAFPSVNINDMQGTMAFMRIDGGDLVLQETSYKVTGKKFFVSKIYEEGLSRYEDYERLS